MELGDTSFPITSINKHPLLLSPHIALEMGYKLSQYKNLKSIYLMTIKMFFLESPQNDMMAKTINFT